MKKIYLLICVLFSAGFNSFAQTYPYLQDFEGYPAFSAPSDWIHTVAPFNIYQAHGGNVQSLSREFSSLSVSDSIISPLIGPIAGQFSVLTFDYRIVEYIGSTALIHNISAGDKIEIKVIVGANLPVTVLTIDMSNHIDASTFARPLVDLSSYLGSTIRIMIKVTRAAGDFWVDIDNFEVQAPEGISENNFTPTDVKLFPNPVSSILNILTDKNVTVKIYDSLGKFVMEKKLSGVNKSISVADLPRGLYSVELINEDKIVRKSFIRE